MIWHLFFQPFIEYGFMRRALVVLHGALRQHHCAGCIPSAASDEPDGGRPFSRHFAGVAVGYLLSGMSLLAMTVGGFIAGIAVALVAGWSAAVHLLKRMPASRGFTRVPRRWASRWCRCAVQMSICFIFCLAPFSPWIARQPCS